MLLVSMRQLDRHEPWSLYVLGDDAAIGSRTRRTFRFASLLATR